MIEILCVALLFFSFILSVFRLDKGGDRFTVTTIDHNATQMHCFGADMRHSTVRGDLLIRMIVKPMPKMTLRNERKRRGRLHVTRTRRLR